MCDNDPTQPSVESPRVQAFELLGFGEQGEDDAMTQGNSGLRRTGPSAVCLIFGGGLEVVDKSGGGSSAWACWPAARRK